MGPGANGLPGEARRYLRGHEGVFHQTAFSHLQWDGNWSYFQAAPLFRQHECPCLDEKMVVVPTSRAAMVSVSRLLSAFWETTCPPLCQQDTKGRIPAMFGYQFPKELAPFDVHLIPANVKDEEAMALTDSIESRLVAEGLRSLDRWPQWVSWCQVLRQWFDWFANLIMVGKKAAEGVVRVKIKGTGDTVEVHGDQLLETCPSWAKAKYKKRSPETTSFFLFEKGLECDKMEILWNQGTKVR